MRGQLGEIKFGIKGFGAFFNSVLDRYSDCIIIFGAAVYLDFYSPEIFPISPYILTLITIMGFLILDYIRARAGIEGELLLNSGIGARTEMLLPIVIFSLVDQVFVGLLFLSILVNLTAIYIINQVMLKTQ